MRLEGSSDFHPMEKEASLVYSLVCSQQPYFETLRIDMRWIQPLLFVIVILASDIPSAHAQGGPWGNNCHSSGNYLVPGVCLPTPTTVVPNIYWRGALYVRCRGYNGGQDEYTSNCCDHLTPSDSNTLRVCEGRTNPESGLGLYLQFFKVTQAVGQACSIVPCEQVRQAAGY